MKAKSAILSELGKDTLLQLVPGLEQLVLERGVVRAYAQGTKVAAHGTPVDQLIIPLAGGLELLLEGRGKIGHLQRLRSLALRELLEGRPYAYDAVADGAVSALHVPGPAVVALIEKVPNLAHYLRLMGRSAGVRSLVRFLEDKDVAFTDVLEIVANIPIEATSTAAGAKIGDAHPTLYLVRRGRVTVRREGVATPLDLGEGAWFGGEALVPPHTRSYEVTAETATSLHAVRLKGLRPVLERLGLVDAMYEEPWLDRGPHAPAESDARSERLTPLPGRPLEVDEVAALGLDVDPKRLLVARSDEESIVASLCNVAALLGGAMNPGRIQASVELLDEVTALRLAEELEAFGFVVRATKVAEGTLSDRTGPALLWAGKRLMVFLGARLGEALLLDPAAGVVGWSEAELAGAWDGTLLEVARVPGDEARTAVASTSSAPRSTVLRLLLRQRRLLGNMAGLMLLGFGLQLLGPLFLQYILDDVLTIGRFDLVWGLVTGLVLATLLRAGAALGGFWLANELGVRFDADLSLSFYRHALALPVRHYAGGRVGDIIVRLHEIQKIRAFFSSSTVGAGIGVVAIFAYTGMLFAFSASVALTALAMVGVLIALQLATRKLIARFHAASFEASRRATSLVAEMFAAITAVKASSAEEMLRNRWEAAFLEGVGARTKVAMRVNDLQAMVNLVSSGGTTLALWFACSAVLAGELSIGVIMAISMYLQSMLKPLQGLSGLLAQLEETGVAFDNLNSVLSATPEEPPSRALVTHSVKLRGKIRLDRVSFAYGPSSPQVLKDVSVTVYPNQVLAIVGRSGSGKSTLANMIAGYVQPTSGRIFYDHYDASMLSVACLRRQIGFVQQGYSLFSGTLAENIAFADDRPDQARIERSAETAYCEYVSTFPKRFEHTLAARGLGLSGGQRQRLAIARAFYQEPNILIMDEAMSALDADAETAISENMREITKGRTTIVIAHRISTVRHADRIIVVENGEIVEDGTHRALLQRGGRYAELFEGQLDSEPGAEAR